MTESSFDVINMRFTYKNIPLYKLEKYSFDDIKTAYDAFKRIPSVSEVVILQTASRVEVFLTLSHGSEKADHTGYRMIISNLKEAWISLTSLDQYDLDHFDQTLELYKNTDAYEHMLDLVTGLDSVVIGKGEILNEMKNSISNAKESGMSGIVLNSLFDMVIRVGTKIRRATGIGDGVITIGDVAIKMAEESVGIKSKKILLIGTGRTAALVAKSMNRKGYGFDVTSRTINRANGFTKILKGSPVEFADVMSGFNKYDIVFVATTADYHILTNVRLKRVMEKKKTGTMILDISEPRAVNEDISSIPGIKLMFRDHIAEQAVESLNARMMKIPKVEEMIEQETLIVGDIMNRIGRDPALENIFAIADMSRKQELEKTINETDRREIEILEDLAKSLVSKVGSPPEQDEVRSSKAS